jgi:hypothetical protein
MPLSIAALACLSKRAQSIFRMSVDFSSGLEGGFFLRKKPLSGFTFGLQ